MVVDKIENSELYNCLHSKFAKAFKYIRETDFSALNDGKYKIEDEDIFALVQEYNTKDKNEAKLEAHKKYIDIQLISSGEELIGVAPLKDQKVIVEDSGKDISFYEGEASFIKLESGMFAIFFPGDLHMPGLKTVLSSRVKKIVIKVLV